MPIKKLKPKKNIAKTKLSNKATFTNKSQILSDISNLVEEAQTASIRSVNSIMTATYWEIGRKIVKVEQKGKETANYGEMLIKNLAQDLTKKYGKGFSIVNLKNFRRFYLSYSKIGQTVSAQLNKTLKSENFPTSLSELSKKFSLPWSAYVCLLSVKDIDARKFYEDEALKGGWSVRQLERQINSAFFERTLLSKNKVAMLTKGSTFRTKDKMTTEEIIKDPFVLEFLNLKDEYSETDLEEALIKHLEHFLLELGDNFTFVGRQKRLRIDDSWFRVDLIFYHRILKCLVIIDLKIGDFSHADAGQMNMYLNYAAEHWTKKEENPPIGLILCSGSKKTVVKYTLQGMKNIMTANYTKKLPSQKLLIEELNKTKKILEDKNPITAIKKKKIKRKKK